MYVYDIINLYIKNGVRVLKTLKKTVSLLLIALMLASFMLPAFAAGDTITDLAAVFTVDGSTQRVRWWYSGSEYFLFLPTDTPMQTAVLDIDASATVTCDGKTVMDNDLLSVLPVGEQVTLQCEGESFLLTVLQSETVPSLHITTESGSMDAVHANKNHKEAADIVIIADGEVILEKELDYIKGRGNSTWAMEKKPYNIKFDKKIDLFGMGSAKKWSLLANHIDRSLLRNHIALSLAEDVEIPYTSMHLYVDLFVNDEYYGSYTLCESVEIGETRVDIHNLADDTEDANDGYDIEEFPLGGDHTANFRLQKYGTQKWVEIPNNPDNITGGYLLEYELANRYPNEVSGFVTDRGQPIVVKEPEYASEAQVKYVAALYQDFEDAVCSVTGYNSKGKHYSEYIDMESFVKMYLFQEYVKNLDAGRSSFYLCLDRDSGRFVAAPVWDFDLSLGKSYNAFGMNLSTSDGWWASVLYEDNKESTCLYLPTILNILFRQDGFFEEAKTMWKTVYAPLLNEAYFDEIYAYSETMAASVAINCIRWKKYTATDFERVKKLVLNYMEDTILTFMRERKEFLDTGLAQNAVRVFFDANGGTGVQFNTKALQLGTYYTAPECNFTNGSLYFKEWNTKADGSGISVKAGSTCLLRDYGTVFYAQWTDKDPNELTQTGKNRLKEMFMEILERFLAIAKLFTEIQ